MIRLTGVTSCAVANTEAGSLALFFSMDSGTSGEWLPCLSVKHGDSATLLALNFRDHESGARSPFLLEGIADQNCLVLGKAEFYVADLSYLSTNRERHLALDPRGPAIIGRVNVPNDRPKEGNWLASTGVVITVDRAVLRPSAWEVGVMNAAGQFEAVLHFPYAQEHTSRA